MDWTNRLRVVASKGRVGDEGWKDRLKNGRSSFPREGRSNGPYRGGEEDGMCKTATKKEAVPRKKRKQELLLLFDLEGAYSVMNGGRNGQGYGRRYNMQIIRNNSHRICPEAGFRQEGTRTRTAGENIYW